MDWATTGTVGGSSQRRGRARRCGRCSLPPPTTRLVGGCGTGDRATKCGKLTGQFCSAGAKGQSFDPRPNWVCPNFGPFPSGEAALFWQRAAGGPGASGRDERGVRGLPPAPCFSVPGAPRIQGTRCQGLLPGHCSRLGGPCVRCPRSALRWRAAPPPGRPSPPPCRPFFLSIHLYILG